MKNQIFYQIYSWRREIRKLAEAEASGDCRRVSAKGKMAEGLIYMLNHWDGLTRFLEDGRIELDTNTVERAIRPIAPSRKNSLFAGSDDGADHWAVIASLLETTKLNNVDPLAWMSATLRKLANGHSARDLDAFMPWNFERITGRTQWDAEADLRQSLLAEGTQHEGEKL